MTLLPISFSDRGLCPSHGNCVLGLPANASEETKFIFNIPKVPWATFFRDYERKVTITL